MATRSIGSGRIALALVAVPVRLYTATSAKSVSFNTLHKCGSRLKQQLVCEREGVVVPHDEKVKAFEFAPGEYVSFTPEELSALESERTGVLKIEEFVPAETVDHLYIQKTYFLGPDKGGSRNYQLLAQAMTRTGRIAVGRFAKRGKDDLVLVRPYRNGLILHECYYANEVYSFDEVEIGPPVQFVAGELELTEALISKMSATAFDASRYADTYAGTVRAAVEGKVAGKAIERIEAPPQPEVCELLEALRVSLAAANENHRVDAAPPSMTAQRGPRKAEPRHDEQQQQQPKRKRRAD